MLLGVLMCGVRSGEWGVGSGESGVGSGGWAVSKTRTLIVSPMANNG